VNSTDTTTVGTTVTSPAAGLCAALGNAGLMASNRAPWNGTGLPVAGSAVRRRELTVLGATPSTTGAPFGADALSYVQFETLRPATPGGAAQHISSTPGDLPPEDPLS
jgi:hypothetical protein